MVSSISVIRPKALKIHKLRIKIIIVLCCLYYKMFCSRHITTKQRESWYFGFWYYRKRFVLGNLKNNSPEWCNYFSETKWSKVHLLYACLEFVWAQLHGYFWRKLFKTRYERLKAFESDTLLISPSLDEKCRLCKVSSLIRERFMKQYKLPPNFTIENETIRSCPTRCRELLSNATSCDK